MKAKGLPALAVVAILFAAVLAPAMGLSLSLLNDSNASVNESSDYGSNTNATDSCSNDTVQSQSPPPTYNDTTNSSATTQQPTNDTDTTEHHVGDVKERVIVGFKEKPDIELIKEYGGEIKHKYNIIPAIAASLPEKAIETLKNNSHSPVAYIERDYEVQAIEDSLPWGVDRIDAELVWNGTEDGCDITEGGNAGFGINVSIIDTGIDYNHPDLADNYKVFGYDFVNGDTDPMDDNGHGTHCAGIIAAVDNDIGVIGVAPEAGLYAVKVLDSSGSGYVSDVIAGIEWSVNNSMNIISMSLGSGSDSTALHDACDAAYNAGLLLVAAAGNDGNPGGSGDNVDYPARYENVIAVAATDINDNRASFSSTGSDVELAAPGVNIYSTCLDDGYATMNGTSMACPHVTGTAALVWYAYPEYSNTEVRQRMQGTAEDLGDAGRDTWYGYGLVDAENAAYVPGDTTPPASVTELKASAVCGTWINWTWNDPADADFSHVIVHLNRTFKTNVSKRLRFYNVTPLEPYTSYEIGTRTVDTAGNVNETWVNCTVEKNGGGEIVILGGNDPTTKLYETSTENGPEDGTAIIDLNSLRDDTENSITVQLADATFRNFVNATSSALGSDIIIPNGSTVNFSAYFSSGSNVNEAYATWKFYKLSGSTETLICQEGNDLTGGVAVPAAGTSGIITGNCSPTSTTELNATDKLKLVINVWAKSIGGGSPANKKATHYWDTATYDSWVQYEYIVPPPVTPFMIYGWVFNKDGSECTNPTVNVTNTNTSTQWQAETHSSYNFYQLILDTTNVSEGNVLEFNATDGEVYNTTNYTVTQDDINRGGIFDFNLTLPSLITEGPTVDSITITPDDSGGEAGVLIDPIPGSNKNVTITAVVSDPNGWNNIDTVIANITGPGIGIVADSPVSLSLISNDTNTATYNGTFNMSFYYANGTYTVNVTATDNSSLTGSNLTTFNYTTAIALELDSTIINFSISGPIDPGETSEVLGDEDMSTLNNATVRNIGNVIIDVEVNGTDMTYNGNVITKDNLEAQIDALGYLDMSVARCFDVNISVGELSLENADFRLNVPFGTPQGNYAGTITLTAKTTC